MVGLSAMAHDQPPTPAVETLTDGVNIIRDVTTQPGIDTLEGRISMLLQGEEIQSHLIELPPGSYLDEHPHETESIIMTLGGEWVLCSRGERTRLAEGDLFWFGPDVPTGYENPFDGPAFLLIFKGTLLNESPEEFVKYLEEVDAQMVAERAEGRPFTFNELPADHPAIVFARDIGADGF